MNANPRGTRASARLRGASESDVWQEIPPEWLHDDGSTSANGVDASDDESVKKETLVAGAFGSSGSELTELSELSEIEEDEEDEDQDENMGADEEEQDEEADEKEDEEAEEEPQAAAVATKDDEENPPLPEGFVEWETVSSTPQREYKTWN